MALEKARLADDATGEGAKTPTFLPLPAGLALRSALPQPSFLFPPGAKEEVSESPQETGPGAPGVSSEPAGGTSLAQPRCARSSRRAARATRTRQRARSPRSRLPPPVLNFL